MKMNDPIEVLLHKESAGLRLDQALKEQLLALNLLSSPPSTKTVKRWIESGVVVYASGERSRPSRRIEGGERLILTLPLEILSPLPYSHPRVIESDKSKVTKGERRRQYWQEVWLRALEAEIEPAELYEIDDSLMVINKPVGIPTAPTIDPRRESLYHRALKRLSLHDPLLSLAQTEIPYLRVIHRLDRDTSGLVVMSRHPRASKSLSQQFAERSVDKRYLVRCHRPRAGLLYEYIMMNETNREEVGPFKYEAYMNEESRSESSMSSKSSMSSVSSSPITRWRVTAKGGVYSRTDFTLLSTSADSLLLEARLYTGRTHQVRVHLSTLQAPIFGDILYGREALSVRARELVRGQRGCTEPLDRLHLHASHLSFMHPMNLTLVKCYVAETHIF